MKTKHTTITIILCFFCLILGFTGNKIYQAKIFKSEIESTKVDNVKSKDINSTDFQKTTSVSNKSRTDYSKILKGKFILEDADYAGFNFIDSKTITWTNEMFPMDPDSMRLKWIDENTFVTTFTRFIDQDCPPRNWIRKVEYYDGHKLIIRNFWTGWNDSKDESETFYKE